MTEEGQFYLARSESESADRQNEDFADSAAHSGLPYDQLLQKIITVGLNYHAGHVAQWNSRDWYLGVALILPFSNSVNN